MHIQTRARLPLASSNRTPWTPLARALALVLASAPAWAQQAAPSAAQTQPGASTAPAKAGSKDEPVSLENVVVTSGKREQRLREVAGSVQVETGAALEARGARDTEDLIKTTPGVILNKSGAAEKSLLTVRGISTVTFNNLVQGATGLYVEDVPFNDVAFPASNPDLAPFDLDRVEVLKGPQGALYGSMSLGGALRYLVNKPNLKRAEGSVLLNTESVTSGGTGYSIYTMANLPVVSDTFALRAVAFRRHDAGYIDKPALGRSDVNQVDQSGGRLLATWIPAGGWRVTGIYQEQTTTLPDAASLNDASLAAGAMTSNATVVAPSRSNWRFANLQIEGDLGNGLKLSSNTGLLKKDFNLQSDNTAALGGFPTTLSAIIGLNPPLPRFTQVLGQVPAVTDAKSQEFRLSSNTGALAYVVGVFYQKIDFRLSSIQTVPGGPGATYATYAPYLFTQSSPGVFTERIVDYSNMGTSTETAVFADGEWALGGDWSLGVGARFSRTKLDDTTLSYTPLGGDTKYNTTVDAIDQTATTPKLSLKRKLAGDGLWYASISRGFRFGGLSSGNPVPPLKSDSLVNYETGLRLSPARNMTLDLTAFYVDWKNAQIIVLDTAGASSFRNAGDARITGLEAAFNARTGAFNWGASATYTDAKTLEPFASLYTFGTNNAVAFTPAGARLPGTPYLQAAATGAYNFEGPFQTSGRASIVVAHQGERMGNTLAIPVLMPAFTTTDLRLSFGTGTVELALFANNVFNEKGILAAGKSTVAGPATYIPNRPRTVGASLRLDF